MERDKLLGTMDAKVWTDEFMATKARLGNKEFDHAMMLSWFANAIMAGFDEANRRAQRALDAEREKVATYLKAAQSAHDGHLAAVKYSGELENQLSQLQALVRAAVSAPGKDWLEWQLKLGEALDATTPVCQICNGANGVPGNENIVNGVVMCDYCHAKGGDGE